MSAPYSRLLLSLVASWSLAGPALAGSAPNAWQITDRSTSSGSLLNDTIQLDSPQRQAAIDSGWSYTVVSRLADDFGGGPAMYMIFGHGNPRLSVFWDLDGFGDLNATMGVQAGAVTRTLTTNGMGARDYHKHELHYDPSTRLVTHLFDDTVIDVSPDPVLIPGELTLREVVSVPVAASVSIRSALLDKRPLAAAGGVNHSALLVSEAPRQDTDGDGCSDNKEHSFDTDRDDWRSWFRHCHPTPAL